MPGDPVKRLAAPLAIRAACERGIPRAGHNRAIRGTIAGEVRAAGLEVVREYPLGDGCVSFGQVICGGERGVRGPRSCDLNCRNGSRGPGRPGHW